MDGVGGYAIVAGQRIATRRGLPVCTVGGPLVGVGPIAARGSSHVPRGMWLSESPGGTTAYFPSRPLPVPPAGLCVRVSDLDAAAGSSLSPRKGKISPGAALVALIGGDASVPAMAGCSEVVLAGGEENSFPSEAVVAFTPSLGARVIRGSRKRWSVAFSGAGSVWIRTA